MVALTAATAPARARLARLVEPVLFSYSQILFTGNLAVGALLLAASLMRPLVGLFGLGSVLLALLTVRLAGFRWEQAARGMYGYNPLLVGLTLSTFLEPGPSMVALVAAAVVATVFLQTALESAIGYFFNLPVLTLPFVLVSFLSLAAAPTLADVEPAAWPGGFELPAALPAAAGAYLQALAAILFQPSLAAGLLVFAALLLYSRIGVLLSLVGFGIATFVVSGTALSSPFAPLVVGYNSLLIAVALGGVWFVPQRGAFVFAAVAALLTALISLASLVALLPLHLPVLILPFNLAMFVGLYAMRQRARDRAPKAVDFAAGSPEVNLNYFRTRLERWGANLAVRFALPFSGSWTVTQGIDGEHTHQGDWRHAFDFEVLDASGSNHSGAGTGLKNYPCYRLPVLATADGTVVRVVRDLADNPVGQRHPTDHWGNLVLLQHGPALYSLVCHLAPGSIEVAEGQFVRQGARLGQCGNTGRSFVPHLHLQFQASPRIGAPTVEVELNELALQTAAGPRVRRAALPAKGDTVRNLDRKEELARLVAFPIGSQLRFETRDARGRATQERVVSRIGLLNDLYLESERGSRLYYESQGRQFLAFDYFGTRESALYLLYAALPRLPFDQPPDLGWDDVLSARHFRPRVLGWAADLLAPFLPARGLSLGFRASREGAGLTVAGEGRLGRRPVQTRARLDLERGLTELSLTIGARIRTARLVEVHDASETPLAFDGRAAARPDAGLRVAGR